MALINTSPFLIIHSAVYLPHFELETTACRWGNRPISERICHLCKSEIGDQFHYIFKCTSFNDERKSYIKPYFRNHPNTYKMYELIFGSKAIDVLHRENNENTKSIKINSCNQPMLTYQWSVKIGNIHHTRAITNPPVPPTPVNRQHPHSHVSKTLNN